MRAILLSLVMATMVAVVAPVNTTLSSIAAPVLVAQSAQAQTPDKGVNVDINVNRGGGVVWYRSPLWIGIGALAVIVLLLIVVLAARGGGTTIVKS